jgi:V/A-type H+-transporting ATPase subunit I
VPEEQLEHVQSALKDVAGEKLHLEVEHPGAHEHHPHAAPAQSQEAAEGHEGSENEAEVPPTHLALAKPFQPFQMFTEMVSVPRYDEIDPTPILALVLPVFLGFMIGDAGYGALMLILGVWMIRSLAKGMPEARDIGIALAAAGVISLFFGGVVFSDAFGIPMFASEPAASCAEFVAEHHEATWTCLLTGSVVVQHPILSKLTDIGDLLILSVLAAFVHMALGLGFGIANSAAHKNTKHIVGKLGWAVLMVGFFAQILYMAGPAFTPNPAITCATDAAGHTVGNPIACAVFGALGLPKSTIPIIGVGFHPFLLGGIVLAAILLAAGEGPITVMELPTMLSNLMSYTRLAGLAIAKGAMAAAFTSLTLVAMVLNGPGGAVGLVLVVVGLVLFVLTQAFVFVLGVFSSSIQAIRLNYVEFFQKFYTGGGVPFVPFGRKRKYTQEA